jgi:hypothetical protein
MFEGDSKDSFIEKVVDYGIGINLTDYKIESIIIDLIDVLNMYSYYNTKLLKNNIVQVTNNNNDDICEIEIGDLGIFFVKYELDMAKSLVPLLVKFFTKKTFS